MFSTMNPNLTPISRDHHKKIFKIIQALLAYEESNIFRKPIPHKSLGWEDYKDIIKKPIDLNYVRRQNSEGKYKFVEEVLDELELIWDNVFTYGKREHESYEMAFKMVKHFDELIKDHLPEYYDKINRVAYFKQFEPVKTEKKTINASNDKNSKKAEKMDVENVKEQVKVQKNPRGTISARRREHFNMNIKQQNEEQSLHAENAVQVVEEAKKKVGSKEKIVESKRSSHKVNEMIQVQQKQPNAEEQKKIEPIEAVKAPEMNQSVDNQKPKLRELVAIQSIPTQQQQLYDQPQIPQQQQQSIPIQTVQSIDAEDSQQNPFPPIIVKLNKTPSNQQVTEVTQMMRLLFELQEMETISKVVKILTKYEKENMVIDGEDVNFRINEIHISTYSRIRKELQDKIKQLEHSQKFKDLNRLKEKLNINLVNRGDKINQKCEGSKIVEEN